MNNNNSNEANEDEWLKNVSNEDLQKFTKKLIERISSDMCENGIFESFLCKVENKISTGYQVPHEIESRPQPHIRKRSKSRYSAADRSITLSWEQKLQVAQIEHEEFKQEIEKQKINLNKLLDNLYADIEELDLRFEDEKKYAADFEKVVVKNGFDEQTKCVASEKFIRFMDERAKQRDTVLDKLRLNNSALKNQLKKCKEQLRQKEEIGEVLHVVDFEQLKIENTQCLSKIDERNQSIQKLKLLVAKILQKLNSLKVKLNELQQEGRRLETEINQRADIYIRTANETEFVMQELYRESQTQSKFKKQITSYHVPSVMDFVQIKREERELLRKQSIYQRKRKIAEMALVRHKKLWSEANRVNVKSAE